MLKVIVSKIGLQAGECDIKFPEYMYNWREGHYKDADIFDYCEKNQKI